MKSHSSHRFVVLIAMSTIAACTEGAAPEPTASEAVAVTESASELDVALPSCTSAQAKVIDACSHQTTACNRAKVDKTDHAFHDIYSGSDSLQNCAARDTCTTALSEAQQAAADCGFAAAAQSAATTASSASASGATAASNSVIYDLQFHTNQPAVDARDNAQLASDELDQAADLFAACAMACCPQPPSNTTATATSANTVRVTWNDNSVNEAGFTVERSVNGGGWIELVETGANAESAVDGSYSTAASYRYRVRAFTAGCTSVPSAVALVPRAPSDLAGVVVSGATFKLTWSDNSNNETHFVGQKKTATTAWDDHFTVAADVHTKNVTLTAGTNRYRVRADSATGSSWYSNEISKPF